MTAIQHTVKKTGYHDIDKILMEVNKLFKEGNQLEKEIAQAVKFKPKTNSFPKKHTLEHSKKNNK